MHRQCDLQAFENAQIHVLPVHVCGGALLLGAADGRVQALFNGVRNFRISMEGDDQRRQQQANAVFVSERHVRNLFNR